MDSPEAVFARAQSAVARADWKGLFECLETATVLKIAANSLTLAMNQDAVIPGLDLAPLRALGQRLMESAQAMPTRPGPEQMQASLRHRDLVREFQQSQQEALKACPDLPGVAAELETFMRADCGGGSVSSQLFQAETLTDLEPVNDKRVRGCRITARGYREEIVFQRSRAGWRIKL